MNTVCRTGPPTNRQSTGVIGDRNVSKETVVTQSAPVPRTSAGLRDAIFDEIDAIRNGTGNPTRANAVAKLANGIVETVRMEIEVQRHLRKKPTPTEESPSMLGVPLSLGTNG